jgi:hypothetical protein
MFKKYLPGGLIADYIVVLLWLGDDDKLDTMIYQCRMSIHWIWHVWCISRSSSMWLNCSIPRAVRWILRHMSMWSWPVKSKTWPRRGLFDQIQMSLLLPLKILFSKYWPHGGNGCVGTSCLPGGRSHATVIPLVSVFWGWGHVAADRIGWSRSCLLYVPLPPR